jgi:hypothetical protein
MNQTDTERLVMLEWRTDRALFADPDRRKCVERRVLYSGELPFVVYQKRLRLLANMRRVVDGRGV